MRTGNRQIAAGKIKSPPKTRNPFWFSISALLIALCPAAEAQQPGKLAQVGYLSLASGPARREAVLKRSLHDLGWIEGQNIVIHYRWSAGKLDRLPFLAAELVHLKVDLIIARATPAVKAAKSATNTIPIVIAASDPVRMGFVTSLAQPRGNVTGVSLISPELGGKRLEIQVAPKIVRVGFLANRSDPSHELWVKEAQDGARRLGIQFKHWMVTGSADIESAFSGMEKNGTEALSVHQLLIGGGGHAPLITNRIARLHLPSISDGPFADVGGLMSYGSSHPWVEQHIALCG